MEWWPQLKAKEDADRAGPSQQSATLNPCSWLRPRWNWICQNNNLSTASIRETAAEEAGCRPPIDTSPTETEELPRKARSPTQPPTAVAGKEAHTKSRATPQRLDTAVKPSSQVSTTVQWQWLWALLDGVPTDLEYSPAAKLEWTMECCWSQLMPTETGGSRTPGTLGGEMVDLCGSPKETAARSANIPQSSSVYDLHPLSHNNSSIITSFQSLQIYSTCWAFFCRICIVIYVCVLGNAFIHLCFLSRNLLFRRVHFDFMLRV